MRNILPDALSCVVSVNGKKYKIKPTVCNVIHAMHDMEDRELMPEHRLELAAWRLYGWCRPKDAKAAVDAAWALINEPSPYRHMDSQQTLDLDQDAALICAAFRQLYGIDLPKESRTMDWRYFQALLGGISEGTVIGGIMAIRAQKLPKRTAHNGEQIREIQKAKAVYALRRRGKSQDFATGLRGMAEVLMSMARKKGSEDNG